MRKLKLVTFKAKEEEHEAWKGDASGAGMSLSEYIRSSLMNRSKKLCKSCSGSGWLECKSCKGTGLVEKSNQKT